MRARREKENKRIERKPVVEEMSFASLSKKERSNSEKIYWTKMKEKSTSQGSKN